MKALIRSLILCITLTLFSCATGSRVAEDSPGDAENYSDSLDTETLAEQVIVKRTDYGVPHIQAENIRSAGYALGYV